MKKYIMSNQYTISSKTLKTLYKRIVKYARKFKTFELLSENAIVINGKYEIVVYAK